MIESIARVSGLFKRIVIHGSRGYYGSPALADVLRTAGDIVRDDDLMVTEIALGLDTEGYHLTLVYDFDKGLA